MFVFPFDKVKQNSKIVLYGAGKVGQEFFLQLMGNQWCEVLLWVDLDFEKYQNQGLCVYPPKTVKEAQFDFLVVSILDKKKRSEICEYLIQIKVDKEKIIYDFEIVNYNLWNAYLIWENRKRKIACKKYLELQNKRDSKVLWIMNIPIHGNLGDHAITIAEKKFLKELFPDIEYIVISSEELKLCQIEIGRKVLSQDIIWITGGGYMGTLWEEEDTRVHCIIKMFPENKIIFMPQTFFYDDEKKIKEDQLFFDEYKNITFIHRERKSYEFFIKNIVNDLNRNFCFPDMCLFMEQKFNLERYGVALCIREDKESIFSAQQTEYLKRRMYSNFEYVKEYTTVCNFKIENAAAGTFVEDILKRFAMCKVIITDRLHGMIFSYVTGTPCVVLNNLSKKVEGTYEWIKDCEWIIFENNIENIVEDVNKLLKIQHVQKADLKKQYITLSSIIENIIYDKL